MPERATDLMRQAHCKLSQLRVDIYVVGQVAIEVHGEQHEEAIQFSNEIEDPEAELERRKLMDELKQVALKAAGIPSIIVWYKGIEKVTPELLEAAIHTAQEKRKNSTPAQAVRHVRTPKSRTQDEEFKRRQRSRAKKWRQKAYQRMKEWKRDQRTS